MKNTSYSSRNPTQPTLTNSINPTRTYSPYIPKSPTKPSPSSPSPNHHKTKTANKEQIQQLAQKHYHQAMKYVYKKNDMHKEMIRKEAEKKRPDKDPLTQQHTFRPNLAGNRYSKKIQENRGKIQGKIEGKVGGKKEVQLTKWGLSKQSQRREGVIQQEVRLMRKSLQKQTRSLQNSRRSSLESSYVQRFIKQSTSSLTKSRQSQAEKIPGVRKFYLNQAKAQAAKSRHEKLLFRGNETIGYYF